MSKMFFSCSIASAEEDAEIDMGSEELDDTKIHQLSHRELFLSRQYETINASQIRFEHCVSFVSLSSPSSPSGSSFKSD